MRILYVYDYFFLCSFFFCIRLYNIKYSYLIQIICTRLYDIKYSYLTQIIWTWLYDIKYSYLTNNLLIVIWYPVFLSNTKNLLTVIWYQVFLSNTTNLLTIIWYQVFLYNTNNLLTIIWYQVFLSNTNNLLTVIWYNIFLSALPHYQMKLTVIPGIHVFGEKGGIFLLSRERSQCFISPADRTLLLLNNNHLFAHSYPKVKNLLRRWVYAKTFQFSKTFIRTLKWWNKCLQNNGGCFKTKKVLTSTLLRNKFSTFGLLCLFFYFPHIVEYISIIYIYMCVCVCVCVQHFSTSP